jgi:excisionase family DNA binding protein
VANDTPAPGPPLLVDAAEAARLLCVSPRTVWSLTQRGELPACRIGRLVRYDPRDLAAYVERVWTTESRPSRPRKRRGS